MKTVPKRRLSLWKEMPTKGQKARRRPEQ